MYRYGDEILQVITDNVAQVTPGVDWPSGLEIR